MAWGGRRWETGLGLLWRHDYSVIVMRSNALGVSKIYTSLPEPFSLKSPIRLIHDFVRTTAVKNVGGCTSPNRRERWRIELFGVVTVDTE